MVADKASGKRDIAGGSMLVEAYAPMWLDLRKPHVAPKTWHGYKYYLEYACGEGGIGRLRLDKVDTLTAQRMVNRLAADGFKNTGNLKAVLSQAFKYAHEQLGYIIRNPFAGVEVPPIEHKEGMALDKTQRAALLAQADIDDTKPVQRRDGAPPPLAPFWHLCSILAFRRGEALALKWQAVNFDKATITISQSRGRLAGVGHIEGKTKGKRVRVVPATPDILDRLKRMRTQQQASSLRHGWKWSDAGYVFCDPRNGDVLTVDHLANRWKRLKKAAGLPSGMRIHDTRHTALSILELDGAPQSVRMALAGHRTEIMAEHYSSHATTEDIRSYIA